MEAERLARYFDSAEYNRGGVEYLFECLELGHKFENPPVTTLILDQRVVKTGKPIDPRSIAITTAYQCYSPGEPPMRERDDERGNKVADATLEAGHHTTRMHPTFAWRFSGITRDTTHEVFHQHPFYNSEQQSQRYVKLESGAFLVPSGLFEKQREHFISSAEFANMAYGQLIQDLSPAIRERVIAVNPKKWGQEKYQEELDRRTAKLCQEIARYAAPICQKTVFYHTLNEISLLRLFRASQMENFSDESRYVVASMITEVLAVHPSFIKELDMPLARRGMADEPKSSAREVKQEIDTLLEGSRTKMIPLSPEQKKALMLAIRNVGGISLESVLDPEVNPYIADTYDAGMHDPQTSALRQMGITFVTKFSHTADSQRQRHRRTPGATPSNQFNYTGIDYITPMIIAQNPLILGSYNKIMETMYENVEIAIEMGVPEEIVYGLLPNAHAVRVVESGDLFDWIHRWRQRSCFRAQEEIFFTTVSQMQQFLAEIPEAKHVLQAPCGVRKRSGEKPFCPEGDMFCEHNVWTWEDLDRYETERTY